MVSSTEIPNAILNIKIVDGLIGIPMYPINAAVVIKGNKLGISDTITILTEENKTDINEAMSKMAKAKLVNKFSTK